MEPTKKQRFYYLDYLRILAIFMVVFNHMCTNVWRDLAVTSTDWKIVNFYCGLTRYPMGLLMMVTGSTFGDPNKNITIKKLFQKNILKMATCFIFWSVFLVVVAPAIDHVLYGTELVYDNVLNQIIIGPFHLWYQYMIIGIYLIVPFLRKITSDEALMKYYIVLAFVFTIFIPSMQEFIGGESIIDVLLLKTAFHFTLGYSPFFVLGYYLHSHEIRGKKEVCLYIVSILSLIFTMVSSYIESFQRNEAFGYYSAFSLFIVIYSVGVFVFFKNHLGKIDSSGRFAKIVTSVSAYSFGIYLMHYYVYQNLQHFGFSPMMKTPLIGIPACTFAICVISYFITAILKKIPIIKDYVC